MTRSLDVFLQAERVGQISLLRGERTLFDFDDRYVEALHRRTLSQNFLSQFGEILTHTRPVSTRLHPFFSNLLPEGHLREYLAVQNHVNPQREFALIEALGEDLPGAVVIRPQPDGLHSSFEENPLKPKPFRFSLAGIQLKFSALMTQGGGLTIPVSGMGGTWIVKLPAANFHHVPENEYAMMTLAKQVGIDVPEMGLISLKEIEGLPDLGPLHGHQALGVKRFDRGPNHTRIHMEDFAQVYGLYPEQKYDKVSYTNMANRIWILCGEQGLVEYIRRLVFCILIGNGDMHLKNWSLLYPDGHTPVLSPAYDLLSTVPYLPGDNLALSFVKTKQMHLCNKDLFQAFIEKAKLPKHLVLETVNKTVQDTKQNWARLKKEFALDHNILAAIDNHMHSIPL
jgi:serine/threonine-protein kinase HipA